jgi:hypothetical protein
MSKAEAVERNVEHEAPLEGQRVFKGPRWLVNLFRKTARNESDSEADDE